MKKTNNDSKLQLVVGIHPESYKLTDSRLSKPVCFKQVSQGIETGSMLVQDIDEVMIGSNRLTYFSPNNVAILLSVLNKSLAIAKSISREQFYLLSTVLDFQKTEEDKRAFLDAKSKDVCDYIEAIQTSIVFGYTALETFSNLSIPPDYVYQVEIKSKGIKELYDKNAIERRISLRDKILYILTDIYKTTRIDKHKFWAHFSKLEKYRHEIIHQKAINSTSFYKAYFQGDIFDICSSPEQIIGFFYDQHATDNRTNPLWPWLINRSNYFPVSYDYDSNSLEVVGNLYEGYNRKTKR